MSPAFCFRRPLDFDYAAWQIVHLFVSPNRVFRSFQYRKKTKNYWARDDPAFYVLFSLFVAGVALLTTLAAQTHFALTSVLRLCLFSLLVECAFSSTLVSFVCSRLKTVPSDLVEWAYFLDVHLNALFVVRFIIFVVGWPFIYAAASSSLSLNTLWTTIANLTWLTSGSVYVYFFYLGIKAVPQLRSPKKSLVFGAIIVFIALWVVLSLANINLTNLLVQFYAHYIF